MYFFETSQPSEKDLLGFCNATEKVHYWQCSPKHVYSEEVSLAEISETYVQGGVHGIFEPESILVGDL